LGGELGQKFFRGCFNFFFSPFAEGRFFFPERKRGGGNGFWKKLKILFLWAKFRVLGTEKFFSGGGFLPFSLGEGGVSGFRKRKKTGGGFFGF